MEAAIENITSLTTASNLVVNQLIEHEATSTITTKATSAEEPKWTTMMAKNMCQVVSRVVETLADAPKQEKHKLNLRLIGFEAKEDEIKNELVQWFNTELLQGQMRLCVEVVVTKRQRPVTSRAATSTASVVLLKFVTSEDRQVTLRGRKGLARTKLGLDEDLTPTQHARKSKLWPLFKEAKAAGKRTFWCVTELFVGGTQICSPSSI